MSATNGTAEEVEPPTELLANALQLMTQEWSKLSQGDDEAVAATADLSVITSRLTALLLTRLVAVVHDRDNTNGLVERAFPDYSTVTICRTLLVQPELWPASVTPAVVQELQTYVGHIVEHYYPTGIVPYHNAEHAYHVTISLSKLLDMMLSRKFGESVVPPSFGLRHQPMALFALCFSGLVHDVEHTGVANRVLASEDNPLAIQYNDQSIAENRSLFVAFDEFLSPQYAQLRAVLVPKTEDYHLLRKYVIDLVLHTDIASPEKTQLGRSKWKEAFLEEVSRRRSLEHVKTTAVVTPKKNGSDSNGKPNTSLASLNIGGKNNTSNDESAVSHNSASEDVSVDTFLTDSDEQTLDSEEAVPEQAPPANPTARPRRANYPNRSPVGATTPTTPSATPPKPILRSSNKKRLGIRRSMDLSGEVLDSYAPKETETDDRLAMLEADQPDELKMTVVMELLMQAADVAHNLQSWDHMVEWSCRLYLELRRAYIQKRGPDVSPNWFANQVSFLELYLEPLAKKLEIVGVFGSMIGPSFARIVKASRDRWLLDGMEVTQAVIDAGEEWYPDDEAVDPLPELSPRFGNNGNTKLNDGNKVDNSAELAELQSELEKTKKALEESKLVAEQDHKKTEGMQRMLVEREAAVNTLKDELTKTKSLQEKEQSQREKYLVETEELKQRLAEQEVLKREHLQQQEELERRLAEQESLKKELQKQEEKQKKMEKQKEEELKREKQRQEDMEKLLRLQEEEISKREKQQQEMEKLLAQQEEIQKMRVLEVQEEFSREIQKHEQISQKALELGKVSSGVNWQTIVMIFMAMALLWNLMAPSILNNLCAPISPGTKILGSEDGSFEAPWFAPESIKEMAFGICGSRARVRIESSKGKLSWTIAKEPKTLLSKNFNHAVVEHDRVEYVDRRGHSTSIEAPWFRPV